MAFCFVVGEMLGTLWLWLIAELVEEENVLEKLWVEAFKRAVPYANVVLCVQRIVERLDSYREVRYPLFCSLGLKFNRDGIIILIVAQIIQIFSPMVFAIWHFFGML